MKWKFVLILAVLAGTAANAQQSLFPAPVGDLTAYLDSSGKIVMAPLFNQGRVFSQGLAAVTISREEEKVKWFYINPSMEIVIKTGFYDAGDFSEGLARVKTGNGWSFIDLTGEYAFSGMYDSALDFRNGYAAVKMNGKWGLIGKTGMFVIEPSYRAMGNYSGSMLPVKIAEGAWIYISLTGELAVKDTFQNAGDFSDGLAPVSKKGNWYYITTSGVQKNKEYFDEARPYFNGVACVRKGPSWVFINKNGDELYGVKLLAPADFSRKLCWVQAVEGRSGYINLYGKWVYEIN